MKNYFLVILVLILLLNKDVQSIKVDDNVNNRIGKEWEEKYIEDEYIHSSNDMEDEFTGRYFFTKELNKLPDWEIKKICDQMERSLLNPFRCVNKTDTNNPNSFGEESIEEFTKKLIRKYNNKPNLRGGSSSSSGSNPLKPIILIPGIAGSGLEAKLDKNYSPSWFCWKKSDWFRLWLSLSEITVQSCWFDNLNLQYNVTSNSYSNAPGVQVRPIDFGGVKGVAYLDYIAGFPITLTDAFGSMVKFLETIGYVVGKNLRGAPYDFRYPIESLVEQGWFTQFQSLIEDTFNQTGQKVNLVAHSMGGMVGLYFLDSVSQEWKDKYIESFIPIAVPWSGAPKVFRAMISGDSFGIPLIKLESMKEFAQNSGGVIQLTPDPLIWNTSQVFVSTPTQNYSISNIQELFNNIGFPSINTIYSSTASTINGMIPSVPTSCIYGYGVPTEIYFNYPDGLNGDPIVYDTNMGDGTVPIESLQYCSTFSKLQTQPVTIQEFNLAEHVGIVQSKQVFEYLYTLLSQQV